VKSLNDDDLNSLLRVAKISPLTPSPGFTSRVERAYARQFRGTSVWRHLLFGTIRVPIPAVFVASAVLLLAGAALGLLVGQEHGIKRPSGQQNAIADATDHDRPVLNLYGLQPVTELHFRIIRRKHEDR
jgi:hypothetical protein